MKNPPIIAFLALGIGIVLIMSAVYDLDPVQALKNVATGQNPKKATHSGGSGGGTFGTAAGPVAPVSPTSPAAGSGTI